jgi:DNA polymerase III subunit alpha
VSLVHLHRHSEWSLGDGVGTSEMYAERAAELGQSALALTDHGSLAGALYHMQACEKAGIKPILGMEAYFRPSISNDRAEKKSKGAFHLVLLAKNMEGWRNLMHLSSQSHMPDNFYSTPNIEVEHLRKYSSGLIATSSCLNGYIPQAILRQDVEAASSHITLMQEIFGDDFYFEIQPHDIPEQQAVNAFIVGMLGTAGIPMIATADVHSPYEDWTETQKVRQAIAYGKSTSDSDQYGGIPTTYLMSKREMLSAFMQHHNTLTVDQIEEAIKTTVDVADKCEHIVMDKSPKVPKATKSTEESERVLREWCEEGLKRIRRENDEVYKERLEEELGIMRKLGVLDYFVFVGDMVRWAKDRGIRVGPGRGSAGGSLVCYLSRITALDPIGYDLLFERFLNEYRTEIPDIDIDFQTDRRDEVKQYLIDKWGADKVIDVAAFQSFGLKAAIKDVARTIGAPFDKTEKATKSIPDKTFGETLETLEEKLPGLKSYFESYPDVRRHATRLQGQIKSLSKHPAAAIVTDQPAEELIPLMRSKDGGIVTQWSERANGQLLSPYGFLKIDMLVTDGLTMQAKAYELMREREPSKYPIENVNDFFESIEFFPVNESPFKSDESVVKSMGKGRNLGIFQFSSPGIQGLLKEIQPENLDHIIAANALYRPGTLSNGMAYEFAERKNGKAWSLPHPATEPFLAKTFGIMVFQEQVMQMYKALGKDVESSESAIFLKVVAKGIARDLKGKEKLQAYYDKFAAGCAELGIPKRSYDKVWEQVLQMTTYAFNRAHSAGYGLQAYQDAWLKDKATLELYNSLLSIEEPKKIPRIVREARALGVHILPPDINESQEEFTIHGNSIRFGLLAVKGIGAAALSAIRQHRPFTSFADFEERVPKGKCNARAKNALVTCGAFDSLGERAVWTEKDKRTGEREILGLAFVSHSDFEKHKQMIEEHTDPVHRLTEIQQEEGSVVVGGEVVEFDEAKTKKGDVYGRGKLELDGDEVQFKLWSEQYGKYRHLFVEGASVLISGSYNEEWDNVEARHCISAERLAEELKKEKKNDR